MLADQLDYVVGVDTHRDAHALAVVAASTGAVVLELEVGADRNGYQRALALARAHAAGCRLWAIEGSGSYGAGLARFLAQRGERVVEVERPQRSERRQGKSDPIDGRRARRWARQDWRSRARAVRATRCVRSSRPAREPSRPAAPRSTSCGR
jgi:transposase